MTVETGNALITDEKRSIIHYGFTRIFVRQTGQVAVRNVGKFRNEKPFFKYVMMSGEEPVSFHCIIVRVSNLCIMNSSDKYLILNDIIFLKIH